MAHSRFVSHQIICWTNICQILENVNNNLKFCKLFSSTNSPHRYFLFHTTPRWTRVRGLRCCVLLSLMSHTFAARVRRWRAGRSGTCAPSQKGAASLWKVPRVWRGLFVGKRLHDKTAPGWWRRDEDVPLSYGAFTDVQVTRAAMLMGTNSLWLWKFLCLLGNPSAVWLYRNMGKSRLSHPWLLKWTVWSSDVYLPLPQGRILIPKVLSFIHHLKTLRIADTVGGNPKEILISLGACATSIFIIFLGGYRKV